MMPKSESTFMTAIEQMEMICFGGRNVYFFYQRSIELTVNSLAPLTFTEIDQIETISVLESKNEDYHFFGGGGSKFGSIYET